VAIDLAALPDDVATLHRMIGDLATALDSERVRAQAAIDRLREIVKALQRGRFGRRSERLDDGQLQLGLEDLDADIARFEASAPPGHDRTNRAGPSPADRVALPDHLARAEMTVDIAPAACPCCGGAVHEIGETISETGLRPGAPARAAHPPPEIRLPGLRDHPSGARA
jgi:transposase